MLDLLRGEEQEERNRPLTIDREVVKLKEKQDRLLDMQLNDKISEEVYLLRSNRIENEIKELYEQKEAIKDEDYELKSQMLFELA